MWSVAPESKIILECNSYLGWAVSREIKALKPAIITAGSGSFVESLLLFGLGLASI